MQTGRAIAKFPKLEDHFFLHFDFLKQIGNKRVGGSVKLKIKFLSPNIVKLSSVS